MKEKLQMLKFDILLELWILRATTEYFWIVGLQVDAQLKSPFSFYIGERVNFLGNQYHLVFRPISLS